MSILDRITSIKSALGSFIGSQEDFIIISISAQHLVNRVFFNDFCQAFIGLVSDSLKVFDMPVDVINSWENQDILSLSHLGRHITRLCKDKKIILMLDGVDIISEDPIFLQFSETLEKNYLDGREMNDERVRNVSFIGVGCIKNTKLSIKKIKKCTSLLLVLGTIIGIIVASIISSSLSQRGFFSSREILRELRSDFPDREFEMVDIFRSPSSTRQATIGLGFDYIELPWRVRIPSYRVYTIRSVDSDTTFTVRSDRNNRTASPSLIYANMLWRRAHHNWQDEFMQMVDHHIDLIYEDYQITRADISLASIGNLSSAELFLRSEHLVFFEKDISSIDQILVELELLEQPMDISLRIRYEVAVVGDFELEIEIGRIRELYRDFLLPFQDRLYYERENRVTIILEIAFRRPGSFIPNYTLVSDFSWEQELSLINERALIAETIDQYDFSRYFQDWGGENEQ